MAWSASAIFREFITDAIANAVAYDLSGTGVDTFTAALYNNSITPDKDSALTGYNEATSQWVTANEVIDTTGGGTDWPAGGVNLASPAVTNPSTGVVMWDANDTASGSTADIANAYGCLVYDNTLSGDPGICFNYFGGANSVTNGTMTVVWSANGVLRITV
jgi:hypothetical protein